MVWHRYSKRRPIIGRTFDHGVLGFLAILQHNNQGLCVSVMGEGYSIFLIPFTEMQNGMSNVELQG